MLLRIERLEDQPPGHIRHRGFIIKTIGSRRERVIGVFRQLPAGGGQLWPTDKKQLAHAVVVPPGASGNARDGDLVAAELTRQARGGVASARVSRRLGSRADAHDMSLIAVHTHGLPHVMPQAALSEAHAARSADLMGREDWRLVPFVSIDPADAHDHDDAVHAAPDSDPANRGGHVLSVAIADVAHYVPVGSALDREALLRGNSVYFPQRVVPMLPEALSADLCSLRPGVDRAALAVRMIIGADGRKRDHSFHRVLIRSRAQLTYEQVQAVMDGTPNPETAPLMCVLGPLFAAYGAVRQARADRAPLELAERKILLNEDGTIDRIITPARLEAHRLIEEFMIQANVAAAETLERARVPLIYRVHDQPALEKLVALRELLRSLRIAWPRAQRLRTADFNRVLAGARGTDIEWLVDELVLRSQSQAEYAARNYGHFGLNLRRYTHFTSPIRRYADLTVHRALLRALRLDEDRKRQADESQLLAEIAGRLSAAERRAMAAEREKVFCLIKLAAASRPASAASHLPGSSSGSRRAPPRASLPRAISVTSCSATMARARRSLPMAPARAIGSDSG